MNEDEKLERVARKICENLGLDPDEKIMGGAFDHYTPAEWQAASINGEVAIPMIAVSRPQWKLYRKEAAIALATKDAILAAED